MQITFGGTIICHGDTRNQSGQAVGPNGLAINELPGNQTYEFIGADRIAPEHNRCDRGTISFSVSRTFETLEAAYQYLKVGFKAEPAEGVLMFDDVQMLGDNVTCTRSVGMVGLTIVVHYNFEG